MNEMVGLGLESEMLKQSKVKRRKGKKKVDIEIKKGKY